MPSITRIAGALLTLTALGAFAQTLDEVPPDERSFVAEDPTVVDPDPIAQDPTRITPEAMPPAYATPAPAYTTPADLRPIPVDNRPTLISRIGLSADVGGGVSTFVNQAMDEITDTGGAWTARVTVGTRSYIGGEVAYTGTANALRTLGVDDRAILLSNGVEGLLRVNAGVGDWQPYAVAGYSYRRFEVRNTASNTSAVANEDDDSSIPVGVGLAYRFRGLVADTRFAVQPSVRSNLLPSANSNPLSISLNGKIGFEF